MVCADIGVHENAVFFDIGDLPQTDQCPAKCQLVAEGDGVWLGHGYSFRVLPNQLPPRTRLTTRKERRNDGSSKLSNQIKELVDPRDAANRQLLAL